MALGDPGIEPVHQAGKLDEPCSGVGRDIGPVLIGPVLIGTVVLSIRLTPLSDGLIQGRRLRAFLHRAMVQNADS